MSQHQAHLETLPRSIRVVLALGLVALIAFPFVGSEFYQQILTERGAVGSYLPARTGTAYQQPDAFFGGQAIYSDFANWLGKIPKVNYGYYTYEADAAIASQLPAYYQGMPLEQVLEQIDSQLSAQIQ